MYSDLVELAKHPPFRSCSPDFYSRGNPIPDVQHGEQEGEGKEEEEEKEWMRKRTRMRRTRRRSSKGGGGGGGGGGEQQLW